MLDTIIRLLRVIGANDQEEEVARVRAELVREDTPLHSAARGGNPAVVKTLIDADADLEARDNDRRTALHWAAVHNANPAVVKALTDAGADPNTCDEDGRTPLYAAVLNSNLMVVKALIDAGADLEACDKKYGRTVLHLAALNANPAVVEALLDAGADPKARDKDDRLPVDYAKDNKALQGIDAYRRLNEARFKE